ncbi:MAG: WecB/TagA/CpsF family glycosyltransferase [Ignavibacterium sp.]|nr:WecB/TagA/CpsF family glycosyltransferase [Ignavibacterium sp.]
MPDTIFNKIICSEDELLTQINSAGESDKVLKITYFNQHCFNIYFSDNSYKKLLDNNFIVYADGFGIKLALRSLFGRVYKSFNATDLNEKIIELILNKDKRFAIIGGNFNQTDFDKKFNEESNFLGYFNGYSDASDFGSLAKSIRTLAPDVVIIGMGVPKQETIAYELSKEINASLFLCVGNFLEFYFGTVKRVPELFRNNGIEWLFRLVQEPKRLWKRYIIGIPLFIFRVLKIKFTQKKF